MTIILEIIFIIAMLFWTWLIIQEFDIDDDK